MIQLQSLCTAAAVVIGTETLTLFAARSLFLPASGLALALAVLLLYREKVWTAGRFEGEVTPETAALDRRLARIEELAKLADGSRCDWDRYLRPMLAREFTLYLGSKGLDDRVDVQELGAVYFGPDVWQWVNPAAVNVPRSVHPEPGPGREMLHRIIDLLEGR